MYDPGYHGALKQDEAEQRELYPEDQYGMAKEYSETKTFRMSEFRNIHGFEWAITYASRRLQLLGKGSSRAVFVYNPKKVLKIAMNQAGVAQNQLESKISRSGKYNEVIAGVFETDPNGLWVISELVVPFMAIDDEGYEYQFEEEKEFRKHSPIDFKTFQEGIAPRFENKIDFDEEEYEQMGMGRKYPSFREFTKTGPSETVSEIQRKTKLLRTMIKQFGLKKDDIFIRSQWGRTSDGRIVLVDYGFNAEVSKKYYTINTPKPVVIEEVFPTDMEYNSRRH
jgi:hypothetical protein